MQTKIIRCQLKSLKLSFWALILIINKNYDNIEKF